jgi:hypothetical protein
MCLLFRSRYKWLMQFLYLYCDLQDKEHGKVNLNSVSMLQPRYIAVRHRHSLIWMPLEFNINLSRDCLLRVYINNFWIFTYSSVSIVTELRAGRPGFDSWQWKGIFLSTTASNPALGFTQPPNLMGSGVFSLGIKRPEHEADHSPVSSAEIKNAWSYTSTPPIRLHSVVLIWVQDKWRGA